MVNSGASTARSRWPALLRALIGLGILWWVFLKIPLDEFKESWAASVVGWPWLIGGIIGTLLGLLAAAFRWHILLRAQSVQLPWSRVFRIFFIGQFFNAFMPGSCGGDAARIYCVFKDTSLKRTEAMSTVVVDRGVGLITLILFACSILLRSKPGWLHAAWIQPLALLILLGITLAIIAFFAGLHQYIFQHLPLLRPWIKAGAWGALLTKVYHAFDGYRRQYSALSAAVVLSLMNMAGLTLACYSFGRGLGIALPLTDYYILFPIITVLSAIPITPGGLGLREGLFAELFLLAGAASAYAVALSLLVYAGGLFWSLFGGLLFIGYSARYGHSLRDEWKKLKAEQCNRPGD